jgi:hypothetical protein
VLSVPISLHTKISAVERLAEGQFLRVRFLILQ